MPRKKQTDKTLLKEPTVSEATDISRPKDGLSANGKSHEEIEDIPFGEIVSEMAGGDDKADVPHFAEADVAPASTHALDRDTLDAAIQEARVHAQPVQDQLADVSIIPQEQPVLLTIPGREVFRAEVSSPPPLIILAATGIMLIFLLTST